MPGPKGNTNALVHGARSARFAERYSDLRTREGRQLQNIIDGLVTDLGGQDQITAGMQLILNQLKSKLIVVLQLSKYADTQPDLVRDGELLGCLGKNFLAYNESIRRDVQALNDLAKNRPSKGPDLNEYLQLKAKESKKS